MDESVSAALKELEEFAKGHDDTWNITPDTGQFLNILILATGATKVLEIGCSNGYSGVWMAEALRQTGGSLVTLELDAERAQRARTSFEKAGISSIVELIEGDARQNLPKLNGPFDLVFLDAWKEDNVFYAQTVLPLLRRGGMIIADNATSHPEDMRAYRDMVAGHPQLRSVVVPIGKGEAVSVKV